MDDLSEQLHRVRKLAHDKLRALVKGDVAVRESILMNDDHYRGHRFQYGNYCAQWLFEKKCVEILIDKKIVETISLDSQVSLPNRQAA